MHYSRSCDHPLARTRNWKGASRINPAPWCLARLSPSRLNVTRNDRGWGDSSDYHALQVQYVRRLSRGVQVLANYTLAHATDSGSDDSTVNLADNATRPTFYYGVA